jgi:hypothetical protein
MGTRDQEDYGFTPAHANFSRLHLKSKMLGKVMLLIPIIMETLK